MEDKSAKYKELIMRLIEQDKEFRDLFGINRNYNVTMDISELINTGIILSGQDWLKLRQDANKNAQQFNSSVVLLECYIDSSFFPEINEYLEKNRNYIKQLSQNMDLKEGKFWYLNYSVKDFINSIDKILDKGYIMTIDYGDNAQAIKRQMDTPDDSIRTYLTRFTKKKSNRYDLYLNPGFEDITTDVDFTYLHMLGKSVGWKTIFFGTQSDLQGHNIKIQDNKYLVPFDLKNNNFSAFKISETIETFLKSSDFKILIQSKGLGSDKFEVIAPQLPLFPMPPVFAASETSTRATLSTL